MVGDDILGARLGLAVNVGRLARCRLGRGELVGVAVHLAGRGLDEPALAEGLDDQLGTAYIDVEAVAVVLQAPQHAAHGGEVDDTADAVHGLCELGRVANVAVDHSEIRARERGAQRGELIVKEDGVQHGDTGVGREEAGNDTLACGGGQLQKEQLLNSPIIPPPPVTRTRLLATTVGPPCAASRSTAAQLTPEGLATDPLDCQFCLSVHGEGRGARSHDAAMRDRGATYQLYQAEYCCDSRADCETPQLPWPGHACKRLGMPLVC